MLPAPESKDGKTVNNPIEANIIAKVCSFHDFVSIVHGKCPLPSASQSCDLFGACPGQFFSCNLWFFKCRLQRSWLTKALKGKTLASSPPITPRQISSAMLFLHLWRYILLTNTRS